MDESSTGLLTGVGIGLLLLRTLLGVADSSLLQISRSRIRQAAEEGHRASQRLEAYLERPHALHASLAVCRTSMSVLLGSLAVWIGLDCFPNQRSARLLVLAAVVTVTLLFEIGAQRLSASNPERLGVALVPFYAAVHRVASPLVAVLSALAGGVAGLFGGSAASHPEEREVTEDDIRLMVEAGRDLEESEKEMIHSIFEMSDTLAREIMVPRVDMVAVELQTSLEQVLDRSLEAGLSRLPVYDQSVDNIVGIVSSKDLLALMRDHRMDTALGQIMRPARFVPGSKKVDELLREMQRDKISMAIVVDEYGGTDGLITMEDVLEEIVGEITDEYDKETPTVEVRGDGSVSVDARVIIEDVNDLLETSLPTDEYETIGGYVYGLLGHVPQQGERARTDDVVIEVEGIDRQRITKVRLLHADGSAFVLPERAAGDGSSSAPVQEVAVSVRTHSR